MRKNFMSFLILSCSIVVTVWQQAWSVWPKWYGWLMSHCKIEIWKWLSWSNWAKKWPKVMLKEQQANILTKLCCKRKKWRKVSLLSLKFSVQLSYWLLLPILPTLISLMIHRSMVLRDLGTGTSQAIKKRNPLTVGNQSPLTKWESSRLEKNQLTHFLIFEK